MEPKRNTRGVKKGRPQSYGGILTAEEKARRLEAKREREREIPKTPRNPKGAGRPHKANLDSLIPGESRPYRYTDIRTFQNKHYDHLFFKNNFDLLFTTAGDYPDNLLVTFTEGISTTLCKKLNNICQYTLPYLLNNSGASFHIIVSSNEEVALTLEKLIRILMYSQIKVKVPDPSPYPIICSQTICSQPLSGGDVCIELANSSHIFIATSLSNPDSRLDTFIFLYEWDTFWKDNRKAIYKVLQDVRVRVRGDKGVRIIFHLKHNIVIEEELLKAFGEVGGERGC